MVGKDVCRGIILFCFSFLFFLNSNAQQYGSETEIKKNAEAFFDQEDYISANPLFSQLLSLYPKDPNYNYKFGVCLLFTTNDKEKPLKYLEFASKKPETEKEIFFFLGRAYHLNYRFSEAVTAYENFKKSGNPKSLKKYDVDQQIAMCRNGISLLKNVKDLYVLEKKSMKEEDFFRAYNTETLKGKLIVKPDEFKTSVDKKKKESSVMFISQVSDELFISSYGQDEKRGKDIFRCKRLPDGTWGQPQNLGSTINTAFDEDYPFLHGDGKTLYFSSKGHNSMGGYDVFKSVYDSSSNTWGQPVNLDFAVSTPDDDIFFMPDSGKTYAYFASKRNSPAGRVDVYKLKIDVIPVEIALIKGKVNSEVGGKSLEAKITVKRAEGGTVVGEFNTNPKNGEYFMSVPNGGRFIFEVESPDFQKKSEIVVVPTQYELRTLRQVIALKSNKLEISNYFDEILSDEDSKALAMAYLKEKAKLEVNYSNSQIEVPQPDVKTAGEDIISSSESNETDNTTSANNNTTTSNKKPDANFSNQELVDIAKEDAIDSRREAEELQDKSDNASYASKTKAEEAKEKLTAAQEIETAAAILTDPVKKEEELNKASLLKKEADLLNKEAAAVGILAETLYKESQEKFKEAKENETYAQDLEQAVKSNSKESIIKLTEQRSQLEANSDEKENDFGLQQIKAEATAKQEEANKAEKSLESLKKELADIETEQKTIKEQADNTKNKKEKQALLQQADLLSPEIDEKKNQIAAQEKKTAELVSEANTANSQLEIFSKILDGADAREILATSNQTGNSVNTSATDESTTSSVNKTASEETINQKHETDIATASQLADGSEKQKQLAQAYDKWAADLQAEAEKKKAELKKITDPQKRSQIADAIMALEASSAEKMALASDARANADELATTATESNNEGSASNSESVVAVNNSNTENNSENTTNSSGTESTSTSTEQVNSNSTTSTVTLADVNNSKETIEKINSSYTSEMASVETISSEVDKDIAKLSVLDKWVKDLSIQTTDLKKKIAETSDPEVKKALEDQLALVQKVYEEKQTQASVAFARAERSKKQQSEIAEIIKSRSGKESDYSADYVKKINAADSISDNKTRDAKKAEIYDEWIADLRAEKSTLESLLPKVGDDSTKQEFSKRIQELDVFLNEQNVLAENAHKSGEGSTVIADNTSSKESQNENNVASPISSEKVNQINTDYAKQFALVDTISDSSRRQSEQTKVLNAWSEQLAKTASEIRTEAGSLTDEQQKNAELARANELENSARDKRVEAARLSESLANNETKVNSTTTQNTGSDNGSVAPIVSTENSSSENITTSNTTSENTSATKSVEKPEPVRTEEFKTEIAAIDAKPESDELTKAEDKRKIYDSWSRDIEKQITYLKSEKESTSDTTKQNELNAQIAELEKESLEKQAQASLQVAKADRLRKQKQAEESLASTNSQNNNSNNEVVLNRQVSSDLKAEEESSTTTEKIPDQPVMTVSASAQAKLKESERLQVMADSLRQTIASEPDQTKRTELIAKATELDKQSYKVRVEASTEMATGNNKRFDQNTAAVNEYVAASARNLSDEVTMANMLATESVYYNKEAKKIRETVDTKDPNSSTVAALERAEEYESLSVEKQEKALNLFAKGNPDYVLTNKVGSQPELTQNNGNNSTQNSLTENTSGSQSARLTENGSSTDNETSNNTSETTLNQTGTANENSNSNLNNNTTTNESVSNASVNNTNSDGSTASVNTSTSENSTVVNSTSQSSSTSSETTTSIQNDASITDNSNNGETVSEGLSSNGNVNETTTSDTVTASTENQGSSAGERKFATKSDSLNANRISSEAQRLEILAGKEEQNVASLRQASVKEKVVADSLKTEAAKLERAGEKNELIKESETHAKLSQLYSERADSVASIATNSKAAAKAKREEAELLALSKTKAPESSETTNGNQARTVNTNTNENAGNNVTSNTVPVNNAAANTSAEEIPSDYLTETNELKREIFVAFANKAAYSASKPIPIDEKIPNGIIYKVQVGAFRNPIAPEVLKGFAPLMGETSPNGITRYTAGFFKSFDNANNARRDINGMGYRDAFVVAFCNGKRIPVNEAQRMVREGKQCSTDVIASNTGVQPVTANNNTTSGTVENSSATSNATERNEIQATVQNTGLSNENSVQTAHVAVQQVKGLFYTVQVGVYSAKIPASKLNFLQPLFTENTENGLVRYSVGIYDNIELAKQAKRIVLETGIRDAFVTAYVNGKRIPVAEAQKIEAENGKTAFASDPMMNKMPTSGNTASTYNRTEATIQTQTQVSPALNNTVETPASTITNTSNVNTYTPSNERSFKTVIPLSDTGLVFRVQIGAFKDEVPLDIAAKFIKIADKGINHYVADSLTIYTVGGSRDFETAEKVKHEVSSEGLTDAFIVAYRRGEKISLEEAKNQANIKY